MPSVVQELVHIHAANKRGGALLGTDEVERQKQEKAGEDCPGQNVADRDGSRQRRCKRPQYRVCHEYSPRIARPVRASKLSRTGSGSRRLKVEYGGATAPDSHRLPASRMHPHDRKRCLVLSNATAKRKASPLTDRDNDPTSALQGMCRACRAGISQRPGNRGKGLRTDCRSIRQRRAAYRLSGILRARLPALGLSAGADQEPRILQAHDRQFDRSAGTRSSIDRQGARQHSIVVSIGISERSPLSVGCLWNTNLLFGTDGTVPIIIEN